MKMGVEKPSERWVSLPLVSGSWNSPDSSCYFSVPSFADSFCCLLSGWTQFGSRKLNSQTTESSAFKDGHNTFFACLLRLVAWVCISQSWDPGQAIPSQAKPHTFFVCYPLTPLVPIIWWKHLWPQSFCYLGPSLVKCSFINSPSHTFMYLFNIY